MNEWEINNVFNDSARNIDGNLIVMGDFNTGPEIRNRNLSAELPDNYPQIEDLGKDSERLVSNMNRNYTLTHTHFFQVLNLF